MAASLPTPKTSQGHHEKILTALTERGSNLGKWANEHGYKGGTVYKSVSRWAGRTDRSPHGGLSRHIMADLRADLGPEVVPEPRKTTSTTPNPEKTP